MKSYRAAKGFPANRRLTENFCKSGFCRQSQIAKKPFLKVQGTRPKPQGVSVNSVFLHKHSRKNERGEAASWCAPLGAHLLENGNICPFSKLLTIDLVRSFFMIFPSQFQSLLSKATGCAALPRTLLLCPQKRL